MLLLPTGRPGSMLEINRTLRTSRYIVPRRGSRGLIRGTRKYPPQLHDLKEAITTRRDANLNHTVIGSHAFVLLHIRGRL